MATKSIGTSSRDYSTIDAWDDSLAGTLTAAEIGECYNDSELGPATFAAHITTILFYLKLTAASGQSFQDNANVRTNALRYNTSNGVGILKSSSYGMVLDFGTAADVIITRLQIKSTTNASGIGSSTTDMGGAGATIKDCIIECTNSSGGRCIGRRFDANVINCIGIQHGTGNASFRCVSYGVFIGCSAIHPSDISTNSAAGFEVEYGNVSVTSCATFGFTTACSGGTPAGNKNATDLASGMPGANSVHSVAYSQTTPWVDADKDSFDGRLADDANSLHNAGSYDGTNAPNDISGTARSATTPDIGVWELAAAAAGHPAMRRFGQVPYAATRIVGAEGIAVN